MTRLWFAEERRFDGAWRPVLYTGEPKADKHGRLATSGSLGPRIRNIRAVDPAHEGLTLPDLAAIYGTPDDAGSTPAPPLQYP